MKNTKKKLTLNRETVQGLEKNLLQEVRGGAALQEGVMIISCFCSADC